ncbi:DUF6531 domain-containing protein [Pseudomonas savastanoi]|uniref:DUF6531 domain-containing protein n=2 Tax=Pseudomonas savastanoi TaxID=29438 RepID=UPI001EDB7D53|nr:DUF6531 domain-containing protein [Pseudomonas savastanoi]
MNNFTRFFAALITLALVGEESAQARTYKFWWEGYIPPVIFQTPEQGCEYIYYVELPGISSYYRPEKSFYDPDFKFKRFQCGSDLNQGYFGSVDYGEVTCDDSEVLDFPSMQCKRIGAIGRATEISTCDVPTSTPDVFVGNPVNVISGNKMQQEIDLTAGGGHSIKVFRTYNSLNGAWVHNFSSRLDFASGSVVVIKGDSGASAYTEKSGVYTSVSDIGKLSYDGVNSQWIYNSVDRSTYFYSAIGKLIKVSNPDGGNVTLNYVVGSSSTRIQLSDEYENIVELEEDSRHQLLSMKSKDFMVNYTYNSSGMLSRVAKSNGGVEMVRSYKYESPSSDKFLTGILNERGIVYASGEYDSLGRAVSSKHANESQKTEITYGTGYSTVINSLGRKSIYHYDVIGGIQKITSIEGEPTPNCPYSNSTYTYNDRGLVLTKTDAKGLITTYEYNDRGFEISRTEASGTTLARTTTTEWDPDRFLPIRVIEPNRVTVYSYDNQGRELTRRSTSR